MGERKKLIDAHLTAAGDCSTEFDAFSKNFFRNVTLGNNRLKNRFEFIAPRNALGCSQRSRSIVSRADENNKRFAENLFMHGILKGLTEL
jgi:hypothetical protein